MGFAIAEYHRRRRALYRYCRHGKVGRRALYRKTTKESKSRSDVVARETQLRKTIPLRIRMESDPSEWPQADRARGSLAGFHHANLALCGRQVDRHRADESRFRPFSARQNRT